MDIVITKSPNDLNPMNVVPRKMREKYGVCPYCGENEISKVPHYQKGVWLISYNWYGVEYHSTLANLLFWKKRKNWVRDTYVCNKCGANWEFGPYAIEDNMDLMDSED